MVFSLQKWNCCEHTNLNRKSICLSDSPGPQRKGSGADISEKFTSAPGVFCSCCSRLAHSLPDLILCLRRSFFIWLVSCRVEGDRVAVSCTLRSKTWASARYSFLHAAAALLPQTCTWVAASCWVNIINYLFHVLAWCVSLHRMSAAFHKMGLCQLCYDYMSASASLSLQGAIQECL